MRFERGKVLEVLKTQHSLLGERPDTGVLELGWVDGRKQIVRDTEIAVELLCEHVLYALSRIEEAAAPHDVRAIEATVPRGPRGWTRGGALEQGSRTSGADTPEAP
jgi:hypothetical protein